MEKQLTLVIMAAGIGSRFGAKIKQLEPIGPNGELLMDYSVYDAVRAGFTHIVFIIRKDIEQLFRAAIGDRLAKKVKVSYVFQEKDDIPVRRELALLRQKPWGTGQAVLAAKDVIDGNFAVINADDFYGAEAFAAICEYLKTADNTGKAVPEYAMAGFKVRNTLSGNGTVTRGVCTVRDGFLSRLEETKEIKRHDDGQVRGVYNGETKLIADDSPVSMNMWAFTADYMATLARQFEEFLLPLDDSTVNGGEFLVPIAIDGLIKSGGCVVRVLPTDSKWFGMTYENDVEEVRRSIAKSIENGEYPSNLM